MSALEVIKIPVADIDPDPGNPRQQLDEEALTGLAETLQRGQIQPILVYREAGRYRLADGFRRWKAAQLAKRDTIDALVLQRPADEAQVLETQLLANLREDLHPLDYAFAVDRFISATRLPLAEAARRLGTSAAGLSRARALCRLSASVQERLRRGELTAAAAYQISKAGGANDQEALAREAVASTLTRDAVAGRIKRGQKQEKQPGGSAVGNVARATACLGGGRTIRVAGPGPFSLEDLIAWLEELLSKARKARPRGTELPTFIALLRDEAKAQGGDAC